MSQAILTASLQACALIGCTALLRIPLKNRLPKATFLLLWTAALCRLLLPVSIPSPLSLYRLLPDTPSAETVISLTDGTALEGPAVISDTISQALPASGTAFSPQNRLMIVWAAVAALLAVLLLAGWFYSRRQLRDALPLAGNPAVEQWLSGVRLLRRVRVCTSDRITSPLTCGILRPRILLPSAMSCGGGESLRYILSHELVHIRRFDCLRKGLFAAACCLHWFNPLVWLMLVLAGRDMELACDEAVLRRAGTAAREGYAMSLIKLAEHGPAVLAHFSRNGLRERVTAVMRFHRLPAWAAACGTALALAVTAMLATSPWEASGFGSVNAVASDTAEVTIREGTAYVTEDSAHSAGNSDSATEVGVTLSEVRMTGYPGDTKAAFTIRQETPAVSGGTGEAGYAVGFSGGVSYVINDRELIRAGFPADQRKELSAIN